ncbi:hypothetical protein NN561_020046 [Cricetulus griseus]
MKPWTSGIGSVTVAVAARKVPPSDSPAPAPTAPPRIYPEIDDVSLLDNLPPPISSTHFSCRPTGPSGLPAGLRNRACGRDLKPPGPQPREIWRGI